MTRYFLARLRDKLLLCSVRRFPFSVEAKAQPKRRRLRQKRNPKGGGYVKSATQNDKMQYPVADNSLFLLHGTLYSTWYIRQYMAHQTVHSTSDSTWYMVHQTVHGTSDSTRYMVHQTVYGTWYIRQQSRYQEGLEQKQALANCAQTNRFTNGGPQFMLQREFNSII